MQKLALKTGKGRPLAGEVYLTPNSWWEAVLEVGVQGRVKANERGRGLVGVCSSDGRPPLVVFQMEGSPFPLPFRLRVVGEGEERIGGSLSLSLTVESS